MTLKRSPARGAATAALLAGLLSGCGAGSEPPPRVATDAVGGSETLPLQVTVQQSRVAATRGQIEFGFTPLDGAAVPITALQLRDPRFGEVAPTSRVTTVDRLLHIALDLGEALCEGTGTAPPQAAITVPGSDEPIVLPVDAEGDEVLARLHRAACDRRTVLDAAEIAFDSTWSPSARATARGAITIDRSASEQPITLTQVQGTVIFTLEVLSGQNTADDPAYVARLDADEQHLEVPVEVSAARCDAHALAESKKTFSFPIWVSVGDAAPVFLDLEPRGEARAALDELMTVGCHL